MDFETLQKKVEQLRSNRDKARGALEQTAAAIKAEFGCNSLDEARKLVKELEESSEAAEKEYDRLMTEFKEEWGEVLGI